MEFNFMAHSTSRKKIDRSTIPLDEKYFVLLSYKSIVYHQTRDMQIDLLNVSFINLITDLQK
jgi:hypothetical protein